MKICRLGGIVTLVCSIAAVTPLAFAADRDLVLKGDFTYALRVRLNGIEKNSNCILFGGSNYFFTLSYNNLNFVAYKKHRRVTI